MARSIATIQAAIAADRATRPELAGLTSPSATAIYRLIEYLVAVSQWVQETLWDRFKADVDATIARAPAGTAAWYADQALLFQLNDPLVILPTGKPGYAAGTTGERVVTRATAKENGSTGRLFIKVAKAGPRPGTLAPLDQLTELVQLRGYFDRIKFAGTRLEVRSRQADRLRVAAKVYYDPLLPRATVQAAVVAAIENYLAKLEFDGLVYVAKLQDAIQAVPGVRDVQMLTVTAVTGASTAVPVVRVYETEAGYIVPDPTPGNTLADTLTFLPHGQ
ncbi:hypothetical protein GCM10023185_06730 [Hymenobacter saemangeumensis]|uniref:Baseplate J-like C-terminal domain-containing protein n=1 Tax=Hymenobacter saemangeumensis TaxID=1084522 RepID=A0ABP8I2K2_9BACT